MKKLSMAVAGAGFIALGVMGMAPAEAADFTQLDYSGYASVSSPLLPFITGVPGNTVQLPVDVSTVVDNLNGRLSDAEDTELTIPFLSYLKQYLPGFSSDQVSLKSFAGSGSIFSDASKTNKLSRFLWSYSTVDDILTVDGYEFDSIKSCLVGTCYLTGNGTVNATLITPFSPVSVVAGLSFDLAQTATPLPHNRPVEPGVQIPIPPTLDLGSVPEPESSLVVTSETESVPEPTTLFGLLGLGGFFVAKRKQAKV